MAKLGRIEELARRAIAGKRVEATNLNLNMARSNSREVNQLDILKKKGGPSAGRQISSGGNSGIANGYYSEQRR